MSRHPRRAGSGGLPERRACGRAAAGRRGAAGCLAGGVSGGGGARAGWDGARVGHARGRLLSHAGGRLRGARGCGVPGQLHTCAQPPPDPSEVLASASREGRRQPGPHAALRVEHNACARCTHCRQIANSVCCVLDRGSRALHVGVWSTGFIVFLACRYADVCAAGPSPARHCVHFLYKFVGTVKPSGISS